MIPLTSDAAFTPACFALPSGTAPRNRTFHQGRANPEGTATSRTSCRHTAHTLEANVSHDTTNHPAHQRHAPFTPACFARSPVHGATQTHFPPRPRKFQWHCNITNVIWPHVLLIHYKRLARNVLHERFVRDFLQKSRVKPLKRAFRTRLPPKVTRQVSKTSVSYETSSKTNMSHVNVCKRSVSYETSSKTHSYETSSKSQAETSIGAHTSRSPAKQFPAPPNNTRSHANPNVTATLRLPRIFPRPHV